MEGQNNFCNKIPISIGVFFFADISKAVTLNLEIKGIIKRWSEAESFSIFENYDYTN